MTLQQQAFRLRQINAGCRWLEGESGHRVFAMLNAPAEEVMGSALFIPPFGMNIPNLFLPAYCLASAGFRTLRFDSRNNLGASEGSIADFKLSYLVEDARLAAARLAEISGSDDFLIVSTSLAAPAALMLARDYPRARAVLLVPAIDMCGTVDKAAQAPDCTAACRRGDPAAPRVHNIFGHAIRVQSFVDDLPATGLDGVDAVLDAARSVRDRVDLILAERDEYLEPAVRDALVEAVGAERNTTVLANAGHHFAGAPIAMRRAFRRIIEVAEEHFGVPQEQRSGGLPPDPVLLAAGRLERMGMDATLTRQTGGEPA